MIIKSTKIRTKNRSRAHRQLNLSLSDDQHLEIRRYQHIADKAMIRVNNRLRKKGEERETLWEQKQTQRSNKKARSTTLEFRDPSLVYTHLNLPEFHAPPSSITHQDSEDDISEISQPIDKDMEKASLN